MRLITHRLLVVLGAVCVTAVSAGAQAPAGDPAARLREVLPAEVAERVIATVSAARERGLPAQALENRALKYAARGIAPAQIERAVVEHAGRMDRAQDVLRAARIGRRPTGDEVDAAAEVMRMGVDGAAVSALAKAAPSGRSLAVPLFVVGSLVDRGLPSDEALARVRDRLAARASDADLERMPGAEGPDGPRGPRGREGEAGRGPRDGMPRGGPGGLRGPGGPGVMAPGGRPGPGVPQNGGSATAPTRPGRRP